jgi:hypothetical protein
MLYINGVLDKYNDMLNFALDNECYADPSAFGSSGTAPGTMGLW